jgi:hypothetical protein
VHFYDYDAQARLLSIADSRVPDNPIIFHYEERGRKTAVQIFRPEDYRPSTAFAGSPFGVAAMGPNLPGGGSTTTVYDEHDRTIEIQARDSHGELVSRAVRIYDAQGHVSEEHQILDNPETFIPAEARLEILKSPGKSLQGLRDELTKLMDGKTGPYSIAYNYDAQGRVEHTRRRIFSEEQEIETTYNEHGDEESEITRSKQIGSDAPGVHRRSNCYRVERSSSRAGLSFPLWTSAFSRRTDKSRLDLLPKAGRSDPGALGAFRPEVNSDCGCALSRTQCQRR